jgi:hypothetical protein
MPQNHTIALINGQVIWSSHLPGHLPASVLGLVWVAEHKARVLSAFSGHIQGFISIFFSF